MTTTAHTTPLHRLMQRVVQVRPEELNAMLGAAVYFFCILTSFFILRPIRDEMAVASGTRNLPWLFLGTLGTRLVMNPLYASLVSKFPVKKFIPITYGFFVSNLLLFYAAWTLGWDEVMTGRVFFIWTSVYNLFIVSVFWGMMADAFDAGQAKRLFGFIAVGGTLGSVMGSGLTAFFVERVGVANLLLVSAGFLSVALLIVAAFPTLPREGSTSAVKREDEVIGGGALSGMTHVFASPYLSGIAVFILLYTLGSTVLYFAQTDIIGQFYEDREARTAVLGKMEFITQSITAFGQLFLTGRLIQRFGLAVTLAAVPFVSLIGFIALGLGNAGVLPLLATFIVFSVARRSTEFVMTNPSRKILFTAVSREDKYKASSFIETFVYRGGDQLASWGYAGLVALGLSLTGISWVTVPFAAAFFALAVWLGRQHKRIIDQQRAP